MQLIQITNDTTTNNKDKYNNDNNNNTDHRRDARPLPQPLGGGLQRVPLVSGLLVVLLLL